MPSNLIVFYFVYFLGYVGFSTTIPIIPIYSAELGADVAMVGIVVSMTFYTAAPLMIPFGILADRKGPWVPMLAGLALFTLSPVLLAFTSTPAQVIVARIIQGLGTAMYIPGSLSLVINLSPPEKRGEATGWVVTAGQLGLMCGPFASGILLDAFGFRGTFYGCALIGLAGLITAIVLYRRSPKLKQEKKPQTTRMSWGWIKHAIIIAALIVPLMAALGSGTLNGFMPLYGKENAITPTQVGIIIAVYYASSSVLRAPFGKMTDRYGPRPIIILGIICTAIGIGLFSLFHSFLMLSLVAIIFGFGFGLAFPAGMVVAANNSPAHMRGTSMALYTAVFQIGIALASMLMGFVADATSFETMFQVAAYIMAGSAILFFMLSRSKAANTLYSDTKTPNS